MKRTHFVPGLAALCGMLLAAGCGAVDRYVRSRAADLMDVATLELTVGPGLDAHVQALFFGTALGYSNQSGLMMHGRYLALGERRTRGLFLAGATAGEGRHVVSLTGTDDYSPRGGIWMLFTPTPYRGGVIADPTAYSTHGMGALDLAVGASFIFGVHVGFSPLEAADFLLGLTGILDLGGDDLRAPKPSAIPPLPEAPPWPEASVLETAPSRPAETPPPAPTPTPDGGP